MKYLLLLWFATMATLTGYSQVQTSTNKTSPGTIKINPVVATKKETPDDKAMKMTDRAKLDALEKSLYELTNTVNNLQSKLESTTSQLNNTKAKLTETEGKLKSLEKNLANTEGKPTVFQVTSNADNLWNFLNAKKPGGSFLATAIRIDNAVCDGNPNAKIFITQGKQATANAWGHEDAKLSNGGGTLYATYSTKMNKWFIMQYHAVVDGYTDGGHTANEVATSFNAGDVFNVMVLQ